MQVADTQTRTTREEWTAEGVRRFGENLMHWKFVCPVCEHVQTVADFKKFKDRGATPDDARQNCIGRFMPPDQRRGPSNPDGQPCDYTAYGLLRLAPIVVVGEDGTEQFAFAFGPPYDK